MLNAVLVFVLVGATIYYARQTKRTVNELAEARVANSLPALHWQLHPQSAGAGSRASGPEVELNLNVLVTNVGPGPARLLEFDVKTDQGEAFEAPALSIPSTLPAGERIELKLQQRRAAGDYPGTRRVSIRFRYTDLHGLRTYRTICTVDAQWTAGVAMITKFDADERSPAQRRLSELASSAAERGG